MGAELSVEEAALPSISSVAARDAVSGQLGRGQLMDSQGSSLAHDAAWRRRVEDLKCSDETLCQPVPAGFDFDMNERLPDARAALNADYVADARYRLVPLRLSEKQFWRAVFYRIECADMMLGADGCLSPVPPRRTNDEAAQWHAATWSPSPMPVHGRRPLATRKDFGNSEWDGSPGSPGDCQRTGLYTPNGTSIQGYDEFKG